LLDSHGTHRAGVPSRGVEMPLIQMCHLSACGCSLRLSGLYTCFTFGPSWHPKYFRIGDSS
jgi:hypothetical protein